MLSLITHPWLRLTIVLLLTSMKRSMSSSSSFMLRPLIMNMNNTKTIVALSILDSMLSFKQQASSITMIYTSSPRTTVTVPLSLLNT